MNANLNKIAKDLYGKIQTRFADIKIGDENAAVLSKKEDIPNARFFEFEYEENGEPLGTIAITLDADDGIVVQVSGDLVNDDNDTTHHSAYKFIRSFRQFAKDRLLNFDVQNIGKSNLDKRDYQFQAKRKEEPVMAQQPVMESKLYGNARMSYQDLGEARLVIKHSQPVNIDLPAGRTMHIESIYIENAEGERFKYPYKHLTGARALAEHIKHGGIPYDDIGQHIIQLSEELGSLRKFKGYVSRQSQLSEAMANVTGRVIDRIEQIKETLHKLQRTAYYEAFAESFVQEEEVMIPEEVQNDLINRLTIRTFNEELKSVFPYIAKFVNEAELPVVEVSAEDLLATEQQVAEGSAHGYNVARWYEKYGDQIKLTKWLKKEAGLPKDADVYFDDADLVYDVETIVPNALVNPKLKFNDLLTALIRASGSGQELEFKHNAYRHVPAVGSQGDHFDRGYNESIEDQYESFMNDIIREDKDEIFSPNKDAQQAAIEKLNDILSKELKGGPEGVNAINSLKGLIDDPEFLNSLRDIDPDLDVRPLVQQYILATDPNVATQIHFGGEEGGSKEQEAPAPQAAAPAPAPAPAPMPGQELQAAAPEAGAVPPAPPGPEAMAAPAPVAEGKKDKEDKDDLPFEPDENPAKKTTAGKHGQGYSQARHLARQGLEAALKKAKESGATLETQMDFGDKTMSIAEVLECCGMAPQDAGFEPQIGGLESMLKYVSGFYNKDEGNFPLGGTRVKIKVKKAFEDGEFGDAHPEELMKVLKFIDMKDPSGNEQHAVLRLAGVNRPEHEVDETSDMPVPDFGPMMQGILDKFKGMQGSNMPNTKVTNTSSGTINGKDASYDDAMAQIGQMKFKMPKFGDDDTDDGEFDFSNPDDMFKRLQTKIGTGMNSAMNKMPNDNIQVPGGQLNPQEMMRAIMQKMNFNK